FSNGFTSNNRKSIVVDNHQMWIWGYNPTAHNLKWHEMAVMMEGEIALQAQRLFNEVIVECGIEPFDLTPPADPPEMKEGPLALVGFAINEPRGSQSIRDFFVSVISNAQESIRIENAYF